MILACIDHKTLELREITTNNQALLKEAVWIDLLSPSNEEEALVENCLGLGIPTRQEMSEIELSSRLYKDHGNLFMTATMIAQSDSADPKFDPVTFVLTPKQLITIRYIEPQSFKLFTSKLKKIPILHEDASVLFVELLDATVDRLADTLERISSHLDKYSKTIFRPQMDNTDTKLDYRQLMQQLGASGDLNTKAEGKLSDLQSFNHIFWAIQRFKSRGDTVTHHHLKQ